MGDPIEGMADAVLVLAEGARVVRGNRAAAAMLGVSFNDLFGRTVRLAETAGSTVERGGRGRELLEIFADLSSLALFSHDAACSITSWNRGAERISGYAEEDVVGESLLMLVPDHLRADLESVEERVASGERVDRAFTEIQRKDGMPIPIALSVSPLDDTTGSYAGAVVVAQELTEIRLAQAALAEVEHRFQEWEALAHVGRWLWDVGTDAVQWSDELHRMHSVDPRSFDGTLEAHLTVVHPDDRDRLRSLMADAVATSQPFEDGYRVVADGTTRWFGVRAEPTVGSSGDVVGVRGVSHEIRLNAARR